MAELENSRVIPNLITFLSSLLKRAAESNDLNQQLQPQKISVFHGLTRPTISIQSQKQPTLPINSFNVHRLRITSVMVAAKFMDDMFYNNACYAKVGGISTIEMNFLELDFLFGLGFQLNVTRHLPSLLCPPPKRNAADATSSKFCRFFTTCRKITKSPFLHQ